VLEADKSADSPIGRELERSHQITLASVSSMLVHYVLRWFALERGPAEQPPPDGNQSEWGEGQQVDVRMSNLLLKMVKAVLRGPQALGRTLQEAFESAVIPSWIFIRHLSHLMYLLNSEAHCRIFEPLFMQILALYPEALIY